MDLLRLPPEIVFLIAEALSPADQAAFGRCCSQLHTTSNRALYVGNVKFDDSSCVPSVIENYEDISAILGSLKAAHAAGANFNKVWPYDGVWPVWRRSGHVTSLHLAAKRGLDEVVTFLLDVGANVNNGNNFGTGPLYVALANKKETTARILIDHGASLGDETPGINALHIAAGCNLEETVTYLVTTKALDVNSQGPNGDTPLIRAILCIDGTDGMVKNLINHGAHIGQMTQRQGQQVSPLEIALRTGKFRVARTLLDSSPPTDIAIISQPRNLEAVFLRKAERQRGRSVQGKKYVIRRLIEAGYDPNQGANIGLGWTGPLLLKLIVERLHWEQEYLLKIANVRIEDQDSYGFTSLDWAIMYSDHELVAILLRYGAKISQKSVTWMLGKVYRWTISTDGLAAGLSRWTVARTSHTVISHCLQLHKNERDDVVNGLLDEFPEPIFNMVEDLHKVKWPLGRDKIETVISRNGKGMGA